MPNLATYENCTGCGACAFQCPKGCIKMCCDSIGVKMPKVDTSACVECKSCERVCPALNLPAFNMPTKAFAAWNSDSEERRTSASGGIASAIYKHAIDHGYVIVGASQNQDWSVTHKIAYDANDIVQFKNSRYVFSEPYDVYGKVKLLLKDGRKVLMVGLPCQIAAMRKLFPDSDNLVLIDIVCHGIMPTSYLQQHISELESMGNEKAFRMSFRAPEKGTSNYYFTLYSDKNEIIYSKRSIDGDLYNIAFHRCIAYRENCYRCQYAKPKRVSDLTLGDYHGLGLKSPVAYDATDVSVILVNNLKGEALVSSLAENGIVTLDKRPIEEPISGDAQLRRPSPKPEQRNDFETLIRNNNGEFEKTMITVMRKAFFRDKRRSLMNLPRRIVKKLIGIASFK